MPSKKDTDICAGRHGGADTSADAHQSTSAADRETLRRRVLEFVATHAGATCENVEDALGLAHQSASARLSELLKENRIEIIGKGVTRSNRSCRTYGVTA